MFNAFIHALICYKMVYGQALIVDPHIYFEKSIEQKWKFVKFNSRKKRMGSYVINFQGEQKIDGSIILFFVAQDEDELGSYKFDNIGVYDDDFGGYILKKIMNKGDRWTNFSGDGMVKVVDYKINSTSNAVVKIALTKKDWQFKKIETYEALKGLIRIDYYKVTSPGEELVERWERIN